METASITAQVAFETVGRIEGRAAMVLPEPGGPMMRRFYMPAFKRASCVPAPQPRMANIRATPPKLMKAGRHKNHEGLAPCCLLKSWSLFSCLFKILFVPPGVSFLLFVVRSWNYLMAAMPLHALRGEVFPILSGLSRPKSANQFQRLGGRALFNPTVFTPVPGPAHHTVIAEPPPQQGMVAEEVIVV